MNGVGDYYLLTVRYGNSRHFTVAVNNEDSMLKDMSSETVQMVVYDDSGRRAFLDYMRSLKDK